MIDGRNFFDQPLTNNLRIYMWKIATGQRDNYATGCLLDCNYFNGYYKMITIDLSRQQAHDADPKAIKQMNFTGNLNQIMMVKMLMKIPVFSIIEEAKEIILDLSEGTVKVL